MSSYSFNRAILLFLLVSLFLLAKLPNNNLNSVQATKPSTFNGGVFKVDLIHRDSPQSPYYKSSMTQNERLERSPLGYISRGQNIRLSSTYYNNNVSDDSEFIDIIPKREIGSYLVKIAIGTPEQEFFAEIDTGSNLIWVQCFPCGNCTSKMGSLPFDPSKSSTYQAIPCDAPACNKPDVKTFCPSVTNPDSSSPPCNYHVRYAIGSTDGILSTETITFHSSNSNSSISFTASNFGCGTDQSEIFSDGVIGLGLGPSSLISQLGQNINHKFSYCLPPIKSVVNGKLAFGADVTGPGVVSTPLSNGPDPTKYYVTLNSISIEGGNFPMPSNSTLIMIDSGTTLTFLPTSVYESVKSTLESSMGAPTTPSPSQDFDLCYSTNVQLDPPTMVFHFDGADVVLGKINFFYPVTKGVTCLAITPSDKWIIFGNIAQVNLEIGFDLEAKKVSFAPRDCIAF